VIPPTDISNGIQLYENYESPPIRHFIDTVHIDNDQEATGWSRFTWQWLVNMFPFNASPGTVKIWQFRGNTLEWETMYTVWWNSLERMQVKSKSKTKAKKHRRQPNNK